jgi:hypothetical protein
LAFSLFGRRAGLVAGADLLALLVARVTLSAPSTEVLLQVICVDPPVGSA